MRRLINKVKETLKSVNKFGVAAVLVAGVMALSFKADKKMAGTYRSIVAQTWTSAGSNAPNQSATNYELIEDDFLCSDNPVGCTYDLVGGVYKFNSRGTFVPQ